MRQEVSRRSRRSLRGRFLQPRPDVPAPPASPTGRDALRAVRATRVRRQGRPARPSWPPAPAIVSPSRPAASAPDLFGDHIIHRPPERGHRRSARPPRRGKPDRRRRHRCGRRGPEQHPRCRWSQRRPDGRRCPPAADAHQDGPTCCSANSKCRPKRQRRHCASPRRAEFAPSSTPPRPRRLPTPCSPLLITASPMKPRPRRAGPTVRVLPKHKRQEGRDRHLRRLAVHGAVLLTRGEHGVLVGGRSRYATDSRPFGLKRSIRHGGDAFIGRIRRVPGGGNWLPTKIRVSPPPSPP